MDGVTIFAACILIAGSLVMIFKYQWFNSLLELQYKLMRFMGVTSVPKNQFQASSYVVKLFGVVWLIASITLLLVGIRGEPF